MKKIFVLSFFAIFLFSGCELFDLQMPEKVSVKTKADYTFNIIGETWDINEEINIPKVLNEQIGKDAPVKIYDYNPGGNQTTQQYLIEIKPDKFEIDLSDSLGDLDGNFDFGSSFNISNLPDVSIPVPNVTIPAVEKEISISGSRTATLPETEITISDFTIGDITFNGVENCVIGEGSLEFEVEFDSSWSGGSVTWETLSLTGGIAIANDKFTRSENKCTASLKDVTLGAGETTVSCTIKVSAINADFLKLPKVKVSSTITKIASAKVPLPFDFKTSFSIEENLPTEFSSYISKINMGASKIKVTYTNGLPEENDISLKCSSVFLTLNETTRTFTAGKTDNTVTFTATGGEKTIDSSTKIDFNAEISSENIDTPNNKITVKNVKLGENYSFKVAVDFEPVINSVTIKLPNEITNYLKGKQDTSFNPKKEIAQIKHGVFKDKEDIIDFIDNIEINYLNTYLFIKEPAVLKNLKINGNAKLGFDNSGTVSETLKILDTSVSPVGFVKSFPSMPDSTEKTVTTNFKNLKPGSYSYKFEPKSDEVHNALFPSTDSGNLYFDYDLNIGTDGSGANEITIPWSDINTICEKKKLELELAVYVSAELALKINDENDKGALKFTIGGGTENDFLDEEIKVGPFLETPPEDLQTYLDAIKEVSLIYNTKLPLKITNLDNKADTIKLTAKIDYTGTDDDFEIKEEDALTLTSGRITVTDKDINNILTKEFKPSITFIIPRGTYAVPRNPKISADLSIQIKTDGTISFDDVMGGNQL